jgi:methionine synthase II (cobalamin-independent)
MVEPTLSGAYPRSERLVKAAWNADKGLLRPEELDRLARDEAEALVGLQNAHGFSETIDGLFGWQDLLRPVATATPGIEIGGLVRFHETNTFLRRPLIESTIDPGAFDADAFLAATHFTALRGARRIKVVLPSPSFFAGRSHHPAYEDPEEAGRDVAHAINRAARAAVDAGADVVQLNDPDLLHRGGASVALACDLVATAVKGVEAHTVHYAYAGDAAPHWDALAAFPVDRIGVDLLATDHEALGDLPRGRNLLAGILDGTSTLVEPAPALEALIARLAARYGDDRVHVTHAYDLEFVPPDVAEAKLRALSASCRTAEVVQ